MIPTFYGFRAMFFGWLLMLAVAIVGVVLRLAGRLYSTRWFHKLLVGLVPIGMIAIWGGWVTAETGRQPWIVYGKLLTAQAVLAAEARGGPHLPGPVHPDLPDAAGNVRLVRRACDSPRARGGAGERAAYRIDAAQRRSGYGAQDTGRYGVRLSDVYMIFVFLAFAMYIVLDGYDLGIGVLTLFEHDGRRRREMHEIVSWVWDGNESWIVLIALTLWAGGPARYRCCIAGAVPGADSDAVVADRPGCIAGADRPTRRLASAVGEAVRGRVARGGLLPGRRVRRPGCWAYRSAAEHSRAVRLRSSITATPC